MMKKLGTGDTGIMAVGPERLGKGVEKTAKLVGLRLVHASNAIPAVGEMEKLLRGAGWCGNRSSPL